VYFHDALNILVNGDSWPQGILVRSFLLKGKMDSSPLQLCVCSFNCCFVKSSTNDLISLCNDHDHDIIFLQEHWLLPYELSMLSCIHKDFYGYGMSAVDITVDVLVCRSYVGTAVYIASIWRKPSE
jgi:hypothetical protein